MVLGSRGLRQLARLPHLDSITVDVLTLVGGVRVLANWTAFTLDLAPAHAGWQWWMMSAPVGIPGMMDCVRALVDLTDCAAH